MGNSKAILITAAIGMFAISGAPTASAQVTEGQLAADQARDEMARGNNWVGTNLQTVSYTHLTLPTTPYV